jgi:hypothetical protein
MLLFEFLALHASIWARPGRESLSEEANQYQLMSLEIGELDDDEYEADYEADGLDEDSDDDDL